MTNCVITGNPPNGYSYWNQWYNEQGSKGILHNLRISAVNYQPTSQKPEQVEEPKPKVRTLYDICWDWFDDGSKTVPELIDTIEKEWTPLNLSQKENRGFTDGYSMGFDDALNMVRKTLR